MLFVAVLLFGIVAGLFRITDSLDSKLLDLQFKLLRASFPQPVARDSHSEISSRRRDVAAGKPIAHRQPGCNDPATGKPLFPYAHRLFWAPYALVGGGGR